ncbi:MAG: hypothetical protein ACXVCM_21910 [Ktedonobacteraceae bacterium]
MKTPRIHDFDPQAKVHELGSPMENLPPIQKPQPKENKPYQLPERPNVPTPHRPNVRRIITRNSFEIYEDQMDDLRREAYEEKIEGGTGSMSKMVREAIDIYLEKRKAQK